MDIEIDEKLDLKGEVCPYNFVKTKLKLEEMESGQILEIVIDEGEPLKNVPRSIKDDGHEILSVDREGEFYRVVIRKD